MKSKLTKSHLQMEILVAWLSW